MKTIFPVDAEKQMTLSGGCELTIPGGMRVPADYLYVDAGDFLIEKCMAAWDTSGGNESPLDFRLVGPPGGGKNAAVYALAARRKQPLYILQGHEELTAEDLVVSAVLGTGGQVRYMASPLLAAMLEGGICFIDEIAKMRPRALAPFHLSSTNAAQLVPHFWGNRFMPLRVFDSALPTIRPMPTRLTLLRG